MCGIDPNYLAVCKVLCKVPQAYTSVFLGKDKMDFQIVAQIFSQQSNCLGLLHCDKHYALNPNETQNHYCLNTTDSFQQIIDSFFLSVSDRLHLSLCVTLTGDM